MTVQSNPDVLFVTLDSCRFDTFEEAHLQNMKSIGPLYEAHAPGNFTLSSHVAMFRGFTPGIASKRELYVNPKYGKFFRMQHGGLKGKGENSIVLEGENIAEGLSRRGYSCFAAAALGWFNPKTYTGSTLLRGFHEVLFRGKPFLVAEQVDWLLQKKKRAQRPVFAFLNVGETHVPYCFQNADWDHDYNPCVPFSQDNDATECRRRQLSCVEYVDVVIEPLLQAFSDALIIICADHGDAWGEDGLWEHGIFHESVFRVPLLFRVPW